MDDTMAVPRPMPGRCHMDFSIRVLTCLVLLLTDSSLAQELSKLPEALPVLTTSRSQIEKRYQSLGRPAGLPRYATDSGFFDVNYSLGNCDEGWNVPKDRVLSYRYYPSTTFSLAELPTQSSPWFITQTDDLTTFHINTAEGRVIEVRTDNSVASIGYYPTPNQRKKRCQGFPAFDLVSKIRSPFQWFRIDSVETWDSGLIYETIRHAVDNPQYTAQMFVYCRQTGLKECQKVKRLLGAEVRLHAKRDTSRFQISFGGRRDSLEVETYLTPKGKPLAVPEPKYPM